MHHLNASRITRHESAECRQVDRVPVVATIVLLGGFEQLGDGAEAGVAEQAAEGVEADVAAADVGVTVEAAAEGGFGVVEVDGVKAGEADDAVEVAEGAAIGAGGADVVAGGVEVAGVEADAEAVGGEADGVEEPGEVLEAMAQRGALPRGVLEEEADGLAGDGVEGTTGEVGDAAQAGFVAGSLVMSRVEDEPGDGDGGGAAEVEDEAVEGAAADAGVGGGEVDEVVGVGDDRADGRGVPGIAESGDGVGGEGLGAPLEVVAGEEL